MRRLTNEEEGAAAVLVAILLVVLFGSAALAVDVGQLYQERRELQNGADAAALAAAYDCAQGAPVGVDCLAAGALSLLDPTANAYANDNANDAASNAVVTLDAPAQSVTVQTSTRSNGDNFLTHWFASILGQPTTTVTAQATAAWGYPALMGSTLPLTISECETAFNPASSATIYEEVSDIDFLVDPEEIIYFHVGGDPDACTSNTAGLDMPGGFGWLRTHPGTCEPRITEWPGGSDDYWAEKDSGNVPPSDCAPGDLSAAVDTVVFLPVFDFYCAKTEPGCPPYSDPVTGAVYDKYHISGYAGFYLTGYRLKTGAATWAHNPPCAPPDNCISGYFVEATAADADELGGSGYGAMATKLTK